MKFIIVTHVPHFVEQDQYFGYAPYVREMNIWLKYNDEVTIVAPVSKSTKSPIDLAYRHHKINFKKVPNFSFTGLNDSLLSLFKLPLLFCKIAWAMKQADHIHLRCPGNMGLLGCIIQIFFPSKTKTAKYAGNWDPKSNQPWTYKLQKYILNNTFLTRNMQVLVYGNWENQSKNIRHFFTATYSEADKINIQKTINSSVKIKFVFVGGLVEGKNPMYAIQFVEKLLQLNKNVSLDLYGDGVLKVTLEKYIETNNLKDNVVLHGNKNQEVVKKAYQQGHFVMLPSKSEGWPKAIAEGMFWGCVPVATKVSCVPYMLDFGNRGLLLQMDIDKDTITINELIENSVNFEKKSVAASNWSQNYTLEYFESEIQKLLQ
ncbi:glycosyltransferase [Flavobacterium seoulense]|uniref:Glycosyl transferase n=1 Tax=Flavobacterium seoulense TaxID=1492738 RepID=A0A066WZD5_9FLAO|nr:glycosyltransferase [Flavobacterium seoulense]KDN56035.1 glycosyl transferase [Flavobacterium seoulense]